MKVLYVRVSTLDQKTDRQKNDQKEFDLVIEDKCSGSSPFFNREGGKKILTLIEKGMGDFQELYIQDVYFKDQVNNELLLIDIVPSIFSTVTYDYGLLSNKDSRDLYPLVEETTEKFENQVAEPEDYRFDQTTHGNSFQTTN